MSFLREENYVVNAGLSSSNGTTEGDVEHADSFDNYLNGKDAIFFKVCSRR